MTFFHADAPESAAVPRRDAASAARTPAERKADRDRKRALRTRLLAIGSSFVGRLPLPVAAVLGYAAGLAAWACAPKYRERTLRQLRAALGDTVSESGRRRIGRRCHALAGRGLFSWFVLHRRGAERAARQVEGEVTPEVQDVLAAGRGAILVAPHTGLFEAGGIWCARNLGAVVVGRDAGGDTATAAHIAMRGELGVRTIEHGAAREIVRVLRSGGVVAMLPDHDVYRTNGAFVPFFGRLAHTPTGPATLSVRLAVPVVFGRVEWASLTRHRMRIGPVLLPRADLPREDAILELTARINDEIERCVRARPEEWLWMHERWRARPADLPDVPVWPR